MPCEQTHLIDIIFFFGNSNQLIVNHAISVSGGAFDDIYDIY